MAVAARAVGDITADPMAVAVGVRGIVDKPKCC